MHTQWESLANEHILGIAPYEPGKPVEELERELGIHDAIKLASNENPLSPSDRVQRAITDALATLNRYPDGSGYYLRHALARKHNLTAEQVVLGNGSNELIELLGQAGDVRQAALLVVGEDLERAAALAHVRRRAAR